jgi:hypothetical protein
MPIILAMLSDTVWQAIIAAIVTLVLGYMQYRLQVLLKSTSSDAADRVKAVKRDLAESTSATVAKVESVKQDLAESTNATAARLDGIAKVANDTHTLVNNAMGIELRKNEELANRIADMPGSTNAQKDAASEAADKSARHQRKQDKVDDHDPSSKSHT